MKQEWIDRTKELRLKGFSAKDIAIEVGEFSRKTAQNILAEIIFTDEEKLQIRCLNTERMRNAIREGLGKDSRDDSKILLRRRVQQLMEIIKVLEEQKAKPRIDIVEGLETYEKGFIAEELVTYLLHRRGLKCYKPQHLSRACDVLVEGTSGRYYRCEVKGTTVGNVKNTRTHFNIARGYEEQAYSKEVDRIDFWMFVDLATEEVFVVPFDDCPGKKGFATSVFSGLLKYRNRFDLLI